MAENNKSANETDEQEAASASGGKLKKLRSKKVIIAAAAAVVVLGGGAAAAVLLRGGSKDEMKTDSVAAQTPAIFLDMPEVLVNLSSPGDTRTHYLKVKAVLDLPSAQLAEQIKPVMPRVTDAFQTYLRELRPTDLEGSSGLYRLKEELTRRVNAAIAPNRVNAILFKEIVVQ